MSVTQRIAPCLWFDHQAEEAATFYVSIFNNAKIVRIARYTEAGIAFHKKPAGSVMTVEFEIDKQRFTALNGGPEFTFNEAISLQVFCETQGELDDYWEKLSAGGDPAAQQCGWLKDRFGVSWQIVPSILGDLMTDRDPAKTRRVMEVMLTMKKLDIAALESAARG